jgi:hypothetical protein
MFRFLVIVVITERVDVKPHMIAETSDTLSFFSEINNISLPDEGILDRHEYKKKYNNVQ